MAEYEFNLETRTSAVAALNISRAKDVRLMGLALVDCETFQLRLVEFRDDAHFTLLEASLLQCRPLKCVVKMSADGEIDKKKIQQIMTRCGVTLLHGSAADFGEMVTASDLQRYLREGEQTHCLTDSIQELKLARQALYCALKEMGAILDSSLYNQFSLDILSVNRFMRLDKAAFAALAILPTTGERLKSSTSLLGHLNKCRTGIGQQRLISWLTQPSLDVQEVTERHDIVQLLVMYSDLRRTLQQDHLRLIPNLDQLTTKFHKAALKEVSELTLTQCSLSDVQRVNDAVKTAHGVLAIVEVLSERSSAATSTQCIADAALSDGATLKQCSASLVKVFETPLRECLAKLKRFTDLVEYTLDPNAEGLINPSFDPRLSAVAEKKEKIWEQIESHREEVEEDLGISVSRNSRSEAQAVRVVECNSHGFVFRVTKKDQKRVQASKSTYKQIRINKAEFQFTSKRLTILANDHAEANVKFQTLQTHLAQKTVAAATTYWPVIESLADLIGCLDVLAGFAEVTSNTATPYVRPKIRSPEESQLIRMTKCRHVLVEQQLLLRRPDESGAVTDFICNSVELGHPNRLLNVITGPNMGGKSTYIRQIALCCLMAQVGSFVPAESAELSLLDAILCRVGASDDQLQGVSTFLAEMMEAAAILKAATPRSLVLIDELGRGTSTFEGFGLAWEIAKALATDIGCLSLFATHFHEMGRLSDEISSAFNSQVTTSVDVDAGRLVFLFGVKDGCADLSFGVKVAEMAGLNPQVVARAKRKAEELETTEKVMLAKSAACNDVGSSDVASSVIHVAQKVCKQWADLTDMESFMDDCFSNVEAYAETLLALS